MRVDGSDVASFDGVVLSSFVAQVRSIRFSDFGVSGARASQHVVMSVVFIKGTSLSISQYAAD